MAGRFRQARAQAVEFLGGATPALPVRPAEVPQSEETVRNLVGSGKTAALGSAPAWLRKAARRPVDRLIDVNRVTQGHRSSVAFGRDQVDEVRCAMPSGDGVAEPARIFSLLLRPWDGLVARMPPEVVPRCQWVWLPACRPMRTAQDSGAADFRKQRPSSAPVPALTGSLGIQVNSPARLSAGLNAIGSPRYYPDLPKQHCPNKPSEDEPGSVMQASQIPGRGPEFRIVCINCDALGIAFDCAEDAPSSTRIRCRNCGAPRGTLGDLRNLAVSDRQDLFDF